METGGYKGRVKAIDSSDLYQWAAQVLRIAPGNIVNEYGMTEMSSQFYDRNLFEPALASSESRTKFSPSWVRSTVVDPIHLMPVGEGEFGILRHIDLANVDSCAFLQTQDYAQRIGSGFLLRGRLADAISRGCSLDYESS
jgi:hypothetical protein